MFSIDFISKSFLLFHEGSFMMLHEVCLTVMTGQPGRSVGKAVGHLHRPHSGVMDSEWLFLGTGCDAPSGNLGMFCQLKQRPGLPLRRAKFAGISTEFGGKWELCVLRKNKSPLRKKLRVQGVMYFLSSSPWFCIKLPFKLTLWKLHWLTHIGFN